MAGRIPQEFLDRLLDRIDIVELIDARVPLRKAGRNHVACCPFHNERTASFTVSGDKQFFYCFGCGANGNAISFVMDYEQLEFRDAVLDLAHQAGLEVPETTTDKASAAANEAFSGILAANRMADQFFREQLANHPARKRASEYLNQRGVDAETIERFGIGYAPPGWDHLLKRLVHAGNLPSETALEAGLIVRNDNGKQYDRFRDRLMFPIRDRRGQTIAFGARALTDEQQPKYLNSPESPVFHKGRALYGLYEARQANRKLHRLLIVEGYMDVVSLAQFGLAEAIATLGTATTQAHIEQLFRVAAELVFCFDGDPAGRNAAWRALEHLLPALRDGRQGKFLFLPDGEDPDSMIRRIGLDGLNQQIADDSMTTSEYFFDHLTGQVDLNQLEGRARLAELAGPLVNHIPAGALHDLMRNQLAEMTGISANKFNTQPTATATTPNAARNFGLRDRQIRRSLPRYTIALLLAEPKLAEKTGDLSNLHNLSVPGLSLLLQLIEILKESPNLTTAALLERFRDSEIASALQQLAGWQPELPSQYFESEFIGNIKKLEKLHADQYRRLLDKATRGELNGEELELLRTLGRRKASPSSSPASS